VMRKVSDLKHLAMISSPFFGFHPVQQTLYVETLKGLLGSESTEAIPNDLGQASIVDTTLENSGEHFVGIEPFARSQGGVR
jgi:hypothetical protein